MGLDLVRQEDVIARRYYGSNQRLEVRIRYLGMGRRGIGLVEEWGWKSRNTEERKTDKAKKRLLCIVKEQ